MPTAHARVVCVMELQKWSGKTVYFPASKQGERRVGAALNMIRGGMSAADAALAIHERFGVTMRQAYRDIKTARNKITDKTYCQMST
ncbi:MAG: hypothetical protein WBX11_17725 [Thiobacillaceae bacterium]